MLLIITLFVILFLLLLGSVEIVEENTVYVVELFGKFSRAMTPGLNFKLPLVERVAEKVTLRQQNFSVSARYPSKDKMLLDIETNLIFAVIPTQEGIAKYVYALADRDSSIAAAIENFLRTYVTKETYEGVLEKKVALNQHIREDLETQFKEWGINILSFQITEVHLIPGFV